MPFCSMIKIVEWYGRERVKERMNEDFVRDVVVVCVELFHLSYVGITKAETDTGASITGYQFTNSTCMSENKGVKWSVVQIVHR